MGTAHHALGVDVGGTAIKLAVVTGDGRIEFSEEIPTRAPEGPEPAVARIVASARRLLERARLEPAELRAIGLDSAGIIDRARNLVLDAPNLRSFERFPLADRLAGALEVPVFLENDVNAMAYGEWRCGAGRGARHLLCLTLGTGVGGGLVLDGRLYYGACGAAGEIGHITLDRGGPACPCGSSGCLERYVGARYIVQRALEALARTVHPSSLGGLDAASLSPRDIAEAAAEGDALAVAVLEETGEWLGVGLASLANVLNPERIVVGGGVAGAGDFLLEPARRTLRQRAMSVPGSTAEVVPAALGNDASMLGAALLAVARVEGVRA